MYSNEYDLENCLDLCEWASLMIFYGVKQEKPLAAPTAPTALSRSLSIVSQSGVKQSRASGKKLPQAPEHTILPTIDNNAEVKDVHGDIAKHVADEFEKIEKNSDPKSLMFGKQHEFFKYKRNKKKC